MHSIFSNNSSSNSFLSNLTAETACNLFLTSTDKIVIKNLEDGIPSEPELIKRRQEVRNILNGDKMSETSLDVVQTSINLPIREFIINIYNAFSLLKN